MYVTVFWNKGRSPSCSAAVPGHPGLNVFLTHVATVIEKSDTHRPERLMCTVPLEIQFARLPLNWTLLLVLYCWKNPYVDNCACSSIYFSRKEEKSFTTIACVHISFIYLYDELNNFLLLSRLKPAFPDMTNDLQKYKFISQYANVASLK